MNASRIEFLWSTGRQLSAVTVVRDASHFFWSNTAIKGNRMMDGTPDGDRD
jgi:hypothetical protein